MVGSQHREGVRSPERDAGTALPKSEGKVKADSGLSSQHASLLQGITPSLGALPQTELCAPQFMLKSSSPVWLYLETGSYLKVIKIK